MVAAFKLSTLVLALLALCLGNVGGQGTTTLYQRPPEKPVLGVEHPRLARRPGATAFTPEQVHISFAGPGAMAVSWVTYPHEDDGVRARMESSAAAAAVSVTPPAGGRKVLRPDSAAAAADLQRSDSLCTRLRDAGVRSVVQYGTRSGEYEFTVEGDFSCYATRVYQSGAIHHVVLGAGDEGPLPPATTIYFRVGDPEQQWSEERSFTTAPAVGATSLPYRVGLVGDLGQTEHSLSTLQHLNATAPDSVLLVGDLSYADGYQPRWDTWGRLVEPLTSRWPFMYCVGNHEIESTNGVPDFLAYTSRFFFPSEASGSSSPFFYSYDVAGVHVVMLSSYTDYSRHSQQYAWLEADLAAVDRARTPWVVAALHAPWYNSNRNHQGEGNAMRESMEELLYQHGVDVVFAGHVHAYERMERVFDGDLDDCAPIYINIGDGGNSEGLDTHYFKQPEWSAYREPSFGHGSLDLLDETHAVWSWHRNQDAYSEVGDVVHITRNPECKARLTARLQARRARNAEPGAWAVVQQWATAARGVLGAQLHPLQQLVTAEA